MLDQVRAETSAELIDLNVRQLIKAAKAFSMPIVLSTVGVEMGVNDGCSFFISQAVYSAGTTICLLAIRATASERSHSASGYSDPQPLRARQDTGGSSAGLACHRR